MPEATFLSLLFEFAAGVDEFYAQNSPERMFTALRELLNRFPKAIPKELKSRWSSRRSSSFASCSRSGSSFSRLCRKRPKG